MPARAAATALKAASQAGPGELPVTGKDRQHAVAHEFEHFAPVRVHGAGDAVEPGVKRRDHRRRRLGFGERGEAAEIG